MQQRTEEWFAARIGKVTASRIADVCAKTKSGWGASRENYAAQLICERLTGNPSESFSNAAMQWGTDTEPQARAAYEFMTGNAVEEVGFIDHPAIEMSGASPDGVVNPLGLVEIKCPNTVTHIKTISGASIDRKYLYQMQWQMDCTGAAWCDFVSFDPRMPTDMRLWVQRVGRDDKLLAEIRETVAGFLAEIDQTIDALREKFNMEQAA